MNPDDGVVGRLDHASQPERHILAATRPAISGTMPVQAMITARSPEPPPGATRQHGQGRYQQQSG
jgi:hypothetical protein